MLIAGHEDLVNYLCTHEKSPSRIFPDGICHEESRPCTREKTLAAIIATEYVMVISCMGKLLVFLAIKLLL